MNVFELCGETDANFEEASAELVQFNNGKTKTRTPFVLILNDCDEVQRLRRFERDMIDEHLKYNPFNNNIRNTAAFSLKPLDNGTFTLRVRLHEKFVNQGHSNRCLFTVQAALKPYDFYPEQDKMIPERLVGVTFYLKMVKKCEESQIEIADSHSATASSSSANSFFSNERKKKTQFKKTFKKGSS